MIRRPELAIAVCPPYKYDLRSANPRFKLGLAKGPCRTQRFYVPRGPYVQEEIAAFLLPHKSDVGLLTLGHLLFLSDSVPQAPQAPVMFRCCGQTSWFCVSSFRLWPHLPGYEYQCDICNEDIPTDTILSYCSKCNWGICARCGHIDTCPTLPTTTSAAS